MALATLSIDLEARLAKLEQDLGQSVRITEKHASRMEAAFAKVRTAGAAIGTALVSGLSVSAVIDYVEGLGDAAAQVDRLSKVAGSSWDEFQRGAAAAKSVGMDMEKFSDVMKDVQDKVGDFLATGGGELKDFFEQVAPRVGVTADQFRNLSGPQALQLFYSTLERANVGSKEMVFFLESIADDASLLAPLLRDGGAAFAELGAKAEAAGSIMSDKVVRDGIELNNQIKELHANIDGLGNQIASYLVPRLNQLAAAFKGDGFWATFGKNVKSQFQIGIAQGDADLASARLKEMVGDMARAQEALDRNPHNLIAKGQLERMREEFPKVRAEAERTAEALKLLINGPPPSAGGGRGFVNPDVVTPRELEPWRPDPEKKKEKKGSAPEASAEATAYADAMRQLIEMQQRAQESAAGLTEAEAALQRVMSSAEWSNMPQAWRDLITSQAAAANNALSIAAQDQRLKQLSDTVHSTAKEVMGLDAAQSALYDLMVSPDWARMTDDQRAEAAARAEQASATLQQLEADKKLIEIRKQMLELAERYKEGYFGEVGSKEAIEGFSEAAQKNIGIEKTKNEFEELKQTIEGFGRDSAAALVDFAVTGKNSFSDLVQSMISDIARLVTYRLITQPLFNAIGSMLPAFGGGSTGGGEVSGSGIRFQATGGVWDAGVQRFAAGGVFTNSIVDQPTLFRHAGGLGEMGEAGPEAIMPLQPSAAGGLGVIADLGNGQTVVPVARMPSGKLGISLQRLEATFRSLATDTAPARFATGGVFGAVQTPAPLPRLADGRLLAAPRQVAADGGISGVVINNYSGAKVEQRSVPDGRGGRRIEVTLGDMVAGEMRRPGSSMSQAARTGYGLAPALVGR